MKAFLRPEDVHQPQQAEALNTKQTDLRLLVASLTKDPDRHDKTQSLETTDVLELLKHRCFVNLSFLDSEEILPGRVVPLPHKCK